MVREIEFREIPKEWIEDSLGKKMGLTFSKEYTYLGYFENGVIMGCCAYKNKTPDVAYVNNDFVPEENRGMGIYRKLSEYRLLILTGKRVEGNYTEYSRGTAEKLGGRIVREYKNGAAKIIFEINR